MKKYRGDTIVEVLAAIAVLGLALGAAYALSNRAFNTSVNTNDRVVALALAQGQVEFLRNEGLKGATATQDLINRYPPGQKFCFRDTDGQTFFTSSSSCKSGIYNISIAYCDGSAVCGSANVFTVKAAWSAAGSGSQQQLSIFYKPPS
ncbi:prepilin-type N-terminal cleavage/methylation domain-containing protein [Candidatus Saccharibacteria bacterium]|nr:prepilin-type N-terminal cleavage/methylation domain-containing protein [Candidatus Saccharibacteria bacterium]